MATASQRFAVRLQFTVEEITEKGNTPFHTAGVSYHGLDYPTLVEAERVLLGLLQALQTKGEAAAAELAKQG